MIAGRRKRQGGLTLIELMISITLGLVFISGAITFLLSSHALTRGQEAASRTQENAQFAIDRLTRAIRMAGHHDAASPGSRAPVGQFYTGRCGSFDPCTADGDGADVNGSDRIAVLTNPPEDDGTDGDCVGNPISADALVAARSVVVNLFRVRRGEQTNTLVCDSFLMNASGDLSPVNDEPYELVDGIDAMQIVYGLSNIASVGQTRLSLERYLSADRVSAMPPPQGAPSAWVALQSVRVALLAGSGMDDNAARTAERTFRLLDAAPVRIDDRRHRTVHTATVQINNARL